MTDRVKCINVVVSPNMREDDALPLIAAITLMRGVISVGFDVQNLDDYVAEARARHAVSEKIMAVLYPKAEET